MPAARNRSNIHRSSTPGKPGSVGAYQTHGLSPRGEPGLLAMTKAAWPSTKKFCPASGRTFRCSPGSNGKDVETKAAHKNATIQIRQNFMSFITTGFVPHFLPEGKKNQNANDLSGFYQTITPSKDDVARTAKLRREKESNSPINLLHDSKLSVCGTSITVAFCPTGQIRHVRFCSPGCGFGSIAVNQDQFREKRSEWLRLGTSSARGVVYSAPCLMRIRQSGHRCHYDVQSV